MDDKPGLRIPHPVVALACTLVAAAILTGSAFIVELRVDQARLEERTSRVEQDGRLLQGLPMALGRVEAKLDNLTDEVNKLRSEAATRRLR